jgi:hypothetical protein
MVGTLVQEYIWSVRDSSDIKWLGSISAKKIGRKGGQVTNKCERRGVDRWRGQKGSCREGRGRDLEESGGE